MSKLFLLFQLNEERYALDAMQIVEVLPLQPMKAIPHAPQGVRGVFSYRATPVPIIDLTELIVGRPAERRLTTRIVLIRAGIRQGLLGLITERVTETMQLDPAQFNSSGVGSRGAPFLGGVMHKSPGFIQQILTDELMSGTMCDALHEQSAALA